MSLTFNISYLIELYSELYISSKLNSLVTEFSEQIFQFTQSWYNGSMISDLSSFFLNAFLVLAIMYTAVFLLSIWAKTIKNKLTLISLNNVIYFYFSDLEEELGSVDDALFYFILFGGLIMWFFYLFLINTKIFFNLSWVISLTTIISITGLIIPFFLVRSFGLAFPMYVRGSGRTTSFLFEGILDCVSVSVICMRFFIQNIRFVFIFSAFFELYEFIYDKIFVIYVGNILSLIPTKSTYWLNIYLDFILTWGLYLYYLGHLILLFLAQLSIYFILSFWLFFFLYSTFTLESHEKYFS